MFDNDKEMFEFMQRCLRVAIVSDVLDELGYRHQAMHHRLRPLLPNRKECGFVGRARTVRWMETDHIVEEDPYGLEIDFMDTLAPGDVAVHSTDNTGTNAPWGELMSTIAKYNGAVGCVCDSQIRDTLQIIEMGFPVYCRGIRPVDSKGRARVMDYDVPIRCGDVKVNPHDVVFADFDGIVVIPCAIAEDVVAHAEEQVRRESLARRELLNGKTLREVYDTYQVL